jgi:hypothetical protein
MTIRNQTYIHEEIRSRLNSGNACDHTAQNLLYSRLLSESLNIKIFRSMILLAGLYGCDTWSLTAEEHRLRMFENRVLRAIVGPKRGKVTGGWRNEHRNGVNNLYSSPHSIIRVIK